MLDPFRFLLIAVSGWMNQRQLQVVDYLREENHVLREQLGGRRLRLNDDQRRRLAAKAKGLGRKLLAEGTLRALARSRRQSHERKRRGWFSSNAYTATQFVNESAHFGAGECGAASPTTARSAVSCVGMANTRSITPAKSSVAVLSAMRRIASAN